jgi:hypothetical protein
MGYVIYNHLQDCIRVLRIKDKIVLEIYDELCPEDECYASISLTQVEAKDLVYYLNKTLKEAKQWAGNDK